MRAAAVVGMVLLTGIVGACDMPWDDTGARIRRECESIVRQAAEVSPVGMEESAQKGLVWACLVESAKQGRR